MFTLELAIFEKGLKISFFLRTKVRQDIPVFKVYLRV